MQRNAHMKKESPIASQISKWHSLQPTHRKMHTCTYTGHCIHAHILDTAYMHIYCTLHTCTYTVHCTTTSNSLLRVWKKMCWVTAFFSTKISWYQSINVWAYFLKWETDKLFKGKGLKIKVQTHNDTLLMYSYSLWLCQHPQWQQISLLSIPVEFVFYLDI